MNKQILFGHELEIAIGSSSPNPGTRRRFESEGMSYLCTCDMQHWLGIDNEWYKVHSWDPNLLSILALAETETEMFDYIKEVTEWET